MRPERGSKTRPCRVGARARPALSAR
jgi:hypothetical protein